MFRKKDVLRNFAKFTCTRVSFLMKLQAWALKTLLKKRLWHRCFPVNFAKFLRTRFFTEHLWWLLLCFTQFSTRIRWSRSLATSNLFLMCNQLSSAHSISRFYTETNISNRRSLFTNYSSVSIKSADEVKIIVDVEFHILFFFVKLKTKTLENATFLFKTALLEANVKTNKRGSTKWTFHKEQSFASNYFYLKILFHSSNLI